MQDLIRPSKIQDPELRDMIISIDGLFTKLLILIRKYMKYNLEEKHTFDLHIGYIEEGLYSLMIRVCDNQFMTNYIEEIFKLANSQIKRNCHCCDSCGDSWYLIDIRFAVPISDIIENIFSHEKKLKYILNNIISITSMMNIKKLNFWLPTSWEKILFASSNDDDYGYNYTFDWRGISLSGTYTSAPSATKSLISRSRKGFHLLSAYVKVFEEYMTTIFPKGAYKLDYEATRL